MMTLFAVIASLAVCVGVMSERHEAEMRSMGYRCHKCLHHQKQADRIGAPGDPRDWPHEQPDGASAGEKPWQPADFQDDPDYIGPQQRR